VNRDDPGLRDVIAILTALHEHDAHARERFLDTVDCRAFCVLLASELLDELRLHHGDLATLLRRAGLRLAEREAA
jgi:hypothetical protein